MAGDWMKVEVALPDKPEVWAIAEELNLEPDAVVGKLIRVWRWFDTHTTDGNASSITKKLLDRDVGVTGFTDSMQKVGWLHHSDGLISMTSFDKHNSKSAKIRALGYKRVEKHRNAPSVTKALPEKRREENIYKTKNTTSTATRFDEWWCLYPKKIEKKKAREIWKRRKLDSLADKIIKDTKTRPTACAKWSAGYIPNPTTYLNGDRWEDEYQTPEKTQSGSALPKNDSECIRFLSTRGIQPRPGEQMDDFRRRAEVWIHGY